MSLFAQQKSTGDIILTRSGVANGITCNLTLDNAISKATLVVQGPSDRWFGVGIGTLVVQGFGMSSGDALVYSDLTTPKFTDRKFQGTSQPTTDVSQDWTIVTNTVSGLTRTVTATRDLTNSDSGSANGDDFQMPYATTNSINFAAVRPGSMTNNVGSGHGGSANAAYFANAPLTTLGVEDFSLNATQIYPNPSKGDFVVKTKSGLDKINVYSHVGAFVKTININSLDAVELNIGDLSSGVYLLELVNKGDKSWKKVVLE
jgi:Secretion system C-terminal sorting domain